MFIPQIYVCTWISVYEDELGGRGGGGGISGGGNQWRIHGFERGLLKFIKCDNRHISAGKRGGAIFPFAPSPP